MVQTVSGVNKSISNKLIVIFRGHSLSLSSVSFSEKKTKVAALFRI